MNLNEHKNKTNVRAVAKYWSGRTEEFAGKLKKDGRAHKKFQERVNMLRNFPTVKSVIVTRY